MLIKLTWLRKFGVVMSPAPCAACVVLKLWQSDDVIKAPSSTMFGSLLFHEPTTFFYLA